MVARRLGRRAFGFDPSGSAVGNEATNPLHHVLPEDVEGFGLIPELIGRLPVIATLDDLGVDDLVRILQQPKNSLVGQYKKILKHHGADLEFTDGAIREVARIAYERGAGARGLRAVVEDVLENVLYDPKPSVTYIVTEDAVRGGEVRVGDLLGISAAPLRLRVARRSAGG